MPKKYGVKEKDLVVSQVVNLVLTGKLRSGDRLDRNEIAEELGLSRVPIQEAVVQLEHDGVLSTRYHRGAFVERFDAPDSVLETTSCTACSTGSPRRGPPPTRARNCCTASTSPSKEAPDGQRRPPQVPPDRMDLPQDDQRRVLRSPSTGRDQGRAAAVALPTSFSSRDLPTGQAELLPSYTAETAATPAGDPDAARDACIGRAEVMGRLMLAELVRRRVLPPTPSFLSGHPVYCVLSERKPLPALRR